MLRTILLTVISCIFIIPELYSQNTCNSNLPVNRSDFYQYKFRTNRCEGVYKRQHSSTLIDFIGLTYESKPIILKEFDTILAYYNEEIIRADNYEIFLELNNSPFSMLPYKLDTYKLNETNNKISTAIINKFNFSQNEIFAKGLIISSADKDVLVPVCVTTNKNNCDFNKPILSFFVFRSLTGIELEIYEVNDDNSFLRGKTSIDKYLPRGTPISFDLSTILKNIKSGFYQMKLKIKDSNSIFYDFYEIYIP